MMSAAKDFQPLKLDKKSLENILSETNSLKKYFLFEKPLSTTEMTFVYGLRGPIIDEWKWGSDIPDIKDNPDYYTAIITLICYVPSETSYWFLNFHKIRLNFLRYLGLKGTEINILENILKDPPEKPTDISEKKQILSDYLIIRNNEEARKIFLQTPTRDKIMKMRKFIQTDKKNYQQFFNVNHYLLFTRIQSLLHKLDLQNLDPEHKNFKQNYPDVRNISEEDLQRFENVLSYAAQAQDGGKGFLNEIHLEYFFVKVNYSKTVHEFAMPLVKIIELLFNASTKSVRLDNEKKLKLVNEYKGSYDKLYGAIDYLHANCILNPEFLDIILNNPGLDAEGMAGILYYLRLIDVAQEWTSKLNVFYEHKNLPELVAGLELLASRGQSFLKEYYLCLMSTAVSFPLAAAEALVNMYNVGLLQDTITKEQLRKITETKDCKLTNAISLLNENGLLNAITFKGILQSNKPDDTAKTWISLFNKDLLANNNEEEECLCLMNERCIFPEKVAMIFSMLRSKKISFVKSTTHSDCRKKLSISDVELLDAILQLSTLGILTEKMFWLVFDHKTPSVFTEMLQLILSQNLKIETVYVDRIADLKPEALAQLIVELHQCISKGRDIRGLVGKYADFPPPYDEGYGTPPTPESPRHAPTAPPKSEVFGVS